MRCLCFAMIHPGVEPGKGVARNVARNADIGGDSKIPDCFDGTRLRRASCELNPDTLWTERLMSKGSEIHCYDYVNHPYDEVRARLNKDAPSVFQSATKAAASRAQSVASELRVDVGGIAIGADIQVAIKSIETKDREGIADPVTRLHLEWEAATMPQFFPFMKAELSIYPLTATETQLDFKGFYKPPFGPLGKAVNAVVGHRIAEASVHRFVSEVAVYLRMLSPS